MSLNAATIEILIAKGLSASDILEVARATEVKKDTTNAERQARYRAKRRPRTDDDNAVTVTALPPNDNISNPPPSAKAKGESARGTRLPDDFEVPEEWLTWAMTKRRWSRADAVEEAEQFCRYWQAKAGAGATKRDWFKTWQQWATNSRRPNGSAASIAALKPMTLETHEFMARYQAERDPQKAKYHREEAARLRKSVSIGSVLENATQSVRMTQ